MAIYRVSARFDFNKAEPFFEELTDGTIAEQKPDGREIVASMQRAAVGEDDRVRWTEKCYCDPPLNHERTTVYDRYFTDMQIEQIDDYEKSPGDPFWARLENASA